MTREEEIQKAWDEYRRPFSGSWHTPSNEFIAGFKAGEKFADRCSAKKQTIWHTSDIEPEPNSCIIYTCVGYDGLVFQIMYDPEQYFGMKIGWSAVVNSYNIIKWAYADDIINL